MYKKKKILAFIPARIGSKRLTRKNQKILAGKPLFQHSVDVAKKSKYIDDIIVSSDSSEILNLAISLGCIKNELRPANLSSDTSRIVEAVLYEINKNNLEYDVLVLLQPTFPLRTNNLIDDAIEKYFETETSLVTVIKSKENPILTREIINNKLYKILDESSDVRSQDFNCYYRVVGNIYINNLKFLNNSIIFNENVVPFIINDIFSIDIDTEADFEVARKAMEL
ncbi:MAG: acylneuraminate cytidylyltransferase family protein [Sphaerochaetaceae bacterium]|nr:acylneuraminate cytidylyltransferase family protein [Sphaerochaetaceae bacterium]